MMTAWRDCKLGDVLTLQRGYDLPERDRREGQVPIVSSSGVTGFHDEARARAPGVVTGRYGTLGEVFYVTEDYWPLNTALFVKDFKGNEPRFVAYLLGTLGLARQNAAGAVPGVNRNHLHAMDVRVPPVEEQRRISDILSAYDALIENNTKRIKILEGVARSLYREWFVNFRFPGHDGAKMVSSPLGKVPEGWTVASLREATTKIGSGATPRGGKEAYKAEGIFLIRSLNVYDYVFEFSDLARIDDEQAAELANVTVEAHDVLLNITGASVARCAMVPSDVLPARVNQHVAIVRADPSRCNGYFLLDTLNAEENKRKLLTLAQAGATREALTKEMLSNFPVALPPHSLVGQYGVFAGGIHSQRDVLARQVQVLRATRSVLLPRLVAGDVTAPVADNDRPAPLP